MGRSWVTGCCLARSLAGVGGLWDLLHFKSYGGEDGHSINNNGVGVDVGDDVGGETATTPLSKLKADIANLATAAASVAATTRRALLLAWMQPLPVLDEKLNTADKQQFMTESQVRLVTLSTVGE